MFDMGGIECPVIWPQCSGVDHESMAMKINHKVISAGFVNDKLEASGKSFSLKVGSRPEDSEIIKQHLTFSL